MKRLMGRGLADVRDEIKLFPFRFAEGSESVLRLQLGERTLTPTGSIGAGSAAVEAECRGVPGRAGHQGGHHRSRLLQRRAAAGHQGRRTNRRPGGAAAGERADGRVAGLRPGQAAGRHHRGLRPGRRHLRHLDSAHPRRHLRGAGHQRRHAPGRRRHRQPAAAKSRSKISARSGARIFRTRGEAVQMLRRAVD